MNSPETNQAVAAIARRAAEVIQQRGKAYNEYQDSLGRVCAVGALRVALKELVPDQLKARQYESLLRRHLHQAMPPHISLTKWSDQRTITEEDIAKLFLRTADQVEVDG
jgi:hypothetical protein